MYSSTAQCRASRSFRALHGGPSPPQACSRQSRARHFPSRRSTVHDKPIRFRGVVGAATLSKEEEEEGASSALREAVPSAVDSVLVAPEDYTLAPGQISTVNRISPPHPDDVWEAMDSKGMEWRNQPGGYLREVLTAKVYNVAVESPLEKAVQLSESLGGTLLLKREDLQPVKSFKLRGAFNRMAQLSPEALKRGVIASSAGNHAQGVAMSGKFLSCDAVICMPVTSPAIKVAAVRALGATVELVGETYSETQTHALERAKREGRAFIHPFDDPYTIAGQGTIASEILRQTDMDGLDAVFVAIGGGGLAAGVAAYIKSLKPGIKVFGVEPSGANAMAQSLARGRRVTLSRVDGFADGVAVKLVGQETFRLCRALLDGVLLVDNAAISTAIKDVFNEKRSILEPSGAVAVAGAKAYLSRPENKGSTVVAVTSGANMNFDQLRLVSELADVGGGRESMLVTTIPEERGAFLRFMETALAGSPVSITEFKYRTSGADTAHILFSISLPPRSAETAAIVRRLEQAGCPTKDISSLEVAQIHLRHLVGGRARGDAVLSNERIFQVEFPEVPGALYKFLKTLKSEWNISLFHYRRTGRQSSYALLGVEVPQEQSAELHSCMGSLGEEYTFVELGREGREVFDMFIG